MPEHQRLRAAVLATLAIVAALTARGAVELAGHALLDAPRPSSPPLRSRAARPARADPACAILARNIFDSSQGSISCEEPPAPATVCPPNDPTPRPCPSTLRLVAVYLRRDARPAIALVAREGQPSVVIGVGASLDGAEVVAIEPEHIELAIENGTCALALFDRPARPVALARTIARGAALDGVSITGDRARIERSVLDRLITDPPRAARTTRAVPDRTADGRGALRLFGIGRDHPLGALGVQSGDLVRSIDGRPLDDPDAWLSALTSARTPGRHTVEIERAGAVRTLEIEIADR